MSKIVHINTNKVNSYFGKSLHQYVSTSVPLDLHINFGYNVLTRVDF